MNEQIRIKLFDQARQSLQENNIEKAEKLLFSILDASNLFVGIHKIYGLLGKIFFDKKDYIKAIDFCEKSLKVNPSFELASLGKYLSLIELGKDADAIAELDRFVSKFKVNLYIDTLQELLDDIRIGYAANFEQTIIRLAKANGLETNSTGSTAGTPPAED
mgnify:CR=1 FL=1|jgi:tetratricopeptide (TPR) repeat protein